MNHAIHSAELFSKCKPILVGTGGLTLFPGTPLLEEADSKTGRLQNAGDRFF